MAGCPPAATLPTGCGKDTDCKGTRICVHNACVEPPPRPAATADAGAPTPGDGGAADLAPAAQGTAGDGGAVEAAAPVGPSPMFHVDAMHSGRSRFRAPTSAPKEVMHIAAGGVVFSSPAIGDDGLIVFGAHDRSIYAASSDGTIRWRRPVLDLVWSSPALGPGGVAYVGSDDDHLYALDVKDGSVKWKFTAGPCRTAIGSGPEAARCDVDGVTVAPDGTIYTSADGLYALKPDGTLKWKFFPGATHCAAAPAVGPDGTVYVGCHDDAIYALDPATGQKRWEFRTGDDVDSSPSVAPDGTVYVGSDDHKLYAFSPGGLVKFAVTTNGPVRSSPAQAADGTVYVGSFDGALYAIKPNGAVAWSYRTADRILSSPLVDAAGTVLIGSEDDRLYALTPDGKLEWSVLLDGDVDSTPALGADGTIYVGADDRALHALR
jgi:outer membrane protein assembly factor BamB